MREITTKVYTFDELSEEAQAKAVEEVAGKLGGQWWDSHDDEQIAETLVYAFAEALGTPGRDAYGEGDFPGIPGMKLTGWDLGRGWRLVFAGLLDPDNAPALPWVQGIDEVVLSRDGVRVIFDDEVPTEAVGDMREAVGDAVHEAWKAGRDQMEYMASEERAREWIADNEPEFTEDGELHA